MKNNLKIAVILMLIATVCGLAVSGMNLLTRDIISDNQNAKEEALCKEIFDEYDKKTSNIIIDGLSNEAITKKVVAKDANSNTLGYIYTVSGKNSYGSIVLLVGIDNEGKLVSVEFLENGQSYASTVVEHVDNSYGPGLSMADVNSVDVKCGATYGAKTVKELITIAFNDINGGAQ